MPAAELAVALHAQPLPGSAGGIETNLRALLRSLARLEGSGRQVVIVPGGESSWLRPFLGPWQSVLEWSPIAYAPAVPRHSIPPQAAWRRRRSSPMSPALRYTGTITLRSVMAPLMTVS